MTAYVFNNSLGVFVMKKLNKIVAIIMASSMVVSGQSVFAEQSNAGITVNVNGEKLNFDTQPIIENGRVLVPFRKIFEVLNCAVSYRKNGNTQEVIAINAGDYISAEIGSNKMYVNGEEVKLDTPAVIKDGRTLVPLRAVSECLKAEVNWNNASRTVDITKKSGTYKVSSVSKDETVKSAEGNVLGYISVVYPVIEGDTDFIKNINSEYKTDAEKFISEVKSDYMQDADEIYKDMGVDYRPMEFTLSYGIETNRDGVLSITEYNYMDSNGAHPNHANYSKTFDMNNSKEFKFTDVLTGSEEEVEKTVYEAFKNYFKEIDVAYGTETFDEEVDKNLSENAGKVNWYLTDNSLVMYYNPYDVAPYAAGSPSVEIKQGDNAMLNIHIAQ